MGLRVAVTDPEKIWLPWLCQAQEYINFKFHWPWYSCISTLNVGVMVQEGTFSAGCNAEQSGSWERLLVLHFLFPPDARSHSTSEKEMTQSSFLHHYVIQFVSELYISCVYFAVILLSLLLLLLSLLFLLLGQFGWAESCLIQKAVESVVKQSGGQTCREVQSSLSVTSATIIRFLPSSQRHGQLQRGAEEHWTAAAQLMIQPAIMSRDEEWNCSCGVAWLLNHHLLFLFHFSLPSLSRTCPEMFSGKEWYLIAPTGCRTRPSRRVGNAACPTEALSNVSVCAPALILSIMKKCPKLCCLRGPSPPFCSGSVTPDALLQSCPSLNQLVSGSVNVTVRLPQRQNAEVGGRLAGEKRKKNPSFWEPGLVAAATRHLPVCSFQTWQCVHHPLCHYLSALAECHEGQICPVFQQGWSLLLPCMTRAC